MDIILDTNSLYNDFLLNGADINKIVIKARNKGHNVCIPEVVTHEIIKHFGNAADGAYKHIEKGLKDYERATGESLKSPLTKELLDAQIKGYPRKLRKRIKELGITILAIPEGQEHTLMVKAVNRKKPFKDSGVGFPDALIWTTILKRAEKFSEEEAVASPRIIFVSNNHKDFCGSDKFDLHPDLCKELIAMGIRPEVIKIVPSIEETSKMLFVSSDEIVKKDIVRYVSASDFKSSELYKEITKRIMKYLPFKSFQPEELGLPESFEDPSIDMFDEDFEFVLDSVEILSNTEISIKWDVSLTCLFDFYVYRGDLSYFEDDMPSVYDWDWNKHYVAAQKEKNVWFTVEIIADEKLKRIESFEVDIHPEKNSEDQQELKSANL